MAKTRDVQHEMNRRAHAPFEDKATHGEHAADIVQRTSDEIEEDDRSDRQSADSQTALVASRHVDRIVQHYRLRMSDALSAASRGVADASAAIEETPAELRSALSEHAEAMAVSLEEQIARLREIARSPVH